MPRRLPYIDWARGIAVLLMIHAHILDAWTREADRSGTPFGYLTIAGGLAAPMFLWLAGLGVILSAERRREAGAGRAEATEAVVKRGLEIFILAFLFRLQAFVISPGGAPLKLFRVDILNILGLGIVMAGLVWGASRTRAQAALAFGVLAASAAMATPALRAAEWVSWVPAWPSWYLRPMGEHTTFTGFPWWGFVFAGGAAGTLVARGSETGSPGRVVGPLAAAGAALVGLGFYTSTLPTIYASSSFWTSSPTYFAIRLGGVMLALGACYAAGGLALRAGLRLGPLERLGRSSLFVYWIHVELVYGSLASGLHRSLPLWQLELAYVAFVVAIYGVLCLRDHLLTVWHTAAHVGRTPKKA